MKLKSYKVYTAMLRSRSRPFFGWSRMLTKLFNYWIKSGYLKSKIKFKKIIVWSVLFYLNKSKLLKWGQPEPEPPKVGWLCNTSFQSTVQRYIITGHQQENIMFWIILIQTTIFNNDLFCFKRIIKETVSRKKCALIVVSLTFFELFLANLVLLSS